MEEYTIEEFENHFSVNGIKVHWEFKFLPNGFEAITLFGHIYDVREKEDLKKYLNSYSGKVMVNHEHIHMLQAESFKTKYFGFYLVYLWYWIIGLFKFGVKENASYYNIPFEREAYKNEQNFEYSKTRWKDYR